MTFGWSSYRIQNDEHGRMPVPRRRWRSKIVVSAPRVISSRCRSPHDLTIRWGRVASTMLLARRLRVPVFVATLIGAASAGASATRFHRRGDQPSAPAAALDERKSRPRRSVAKIVDAGLCAIALARRRAVTGDHHGADAHSAMLGSAPVAPT